MKVFIYYIIVSLLMLLLTADVLSRLDIAGVSPNLVLIFIVFIAQKKGVMKGQITGFLLGLMLDLFSGKFIGAHSMAGLITGYSAGHAYRVFMIREIKMEIFLILGASLIYSLVSLLIKYFFFLESFSSMITKTWILILYTLLWSPLVIYVLDTLDKKYIEKD